MRYPLAAALLVAFVLLSCAHTQQAGVCSEYQNLRCVTPLQCSYDATRGCQVCQCAPASYGPPVR